MRTCRWLVVVALCAVGAVALAQAVVVGGNPGGVTYYRSESGGWVQGQQATELTVEQQRKLGLNDEQILKIAEKRRDLEKERAKVQEQMKAAQEAARAANAEVARLNQDMQTLLTLRITKVYESVMNPDQLKAWRQQCCAEQAKQWLQSYKQWLKLTDAQVEDIANLLAPVLEKYNKMEAETNEARERLAELRKADKIDIAAIEKAEKEVAELAARNIYKQRQDDLMAAMRPGLMPDQVEKFDKIMHR